MTIEAVKRDEGSAQIAMIFVRRFGRVSNKVFGTAEGAWLHPLSGVSLRNTTRFTLPQCFVDTYEYRSNY